jgi:hypothetical protein
MYIYEYEWYSRVVYMGDGDYYIGDTIFVIYIRYDDVKQLLF